MKSKQIKQQKQRGGIGEVYIIGKETTSKQMDFDSLYDQEYAPYQQQQQVMLIGIGESNKDSYTGIEQVHIQTGGKQHSDKLIRQFQEIRFCSDAGNLIDMDMPNQDETKSVLTLPQYEYGKFIENRVVEIETPQLINQGYILSYKLYQVKTKSVQKQFKQKNNTKNNQKENFIHNDFHSTTNNHNAQSKNKQQQKNKPNEPQYDTCVSRRFSDFQYLNEILINNYGGFIIPLLPLKNFWTILNLQGKQFAQYRTRSLSQYLNRLLNHKKLKHSSQIKNFLFQQDTEYSTQKGEYLQKTNHLQDKLISLGTGAFQYGKALYNKFLSGQQNRKDEQQIRLTKSKLTKDDLVMSEYELIVGELMRIMADLKALVQGTVEEIRTVDDINTLFGSQLTVQFPNNTTAKSSQNSISTKQINLSTHQIQEQFQQISQFIESCHAAILRRKALKLQIQSLKLQQQTLTEKYKNSPRSLELDIIRSKQNRLNKINSTYAQQLIKQLQFHVDEGKGMLRLFVTKFQQLKKNFFQKTFLQPFTQ